jgi:hypothetical protein
MAKRKSNADMGIPDSAGTKDTGQQHIRFDDSYVHRAQEEYQQMKASRASEPVEAQRVNDHECEFSAPIDTRSTHLRTCTLCNNHCGEEGWLKHFQDCELRRSALTKKEMEEQKKVDDAAATI